jgi:hypothetical protein
MSKEESKVYKQNYPYVLGGPLVAGSEYLPFTKFRYLCMLYWKDNKNWTQLTWTPLLQI